jgi:hypothetical protein
MSITKLKSGAAKASRVSGLELQKLLRKYNLSGNQAAEKIAEVLGIETQTAYTYFSRGIPNVHFQLLEVRLEKERAAR